MDPNGSSGTDDLGELVTERRNVTRLIRVMSMFVAWPSLTAGLAFIVFEGLDEHFLHIAVLVPVGLAAVAAFAMAPRLAERFVRAA